MKTDIILAGVGGQGIISIANVIGVAALHEDLFLKQAEVHGMSQRGGDVQSTLRLSDSPIHSDLIPYGKADLIVSLEPMEAMRYLPYLSKTGWLVTNTHPFINIDNYPNIEDIMQELKKVDNLIAFNMDDMAKNLGSPRSSNMVLLGAASPFIKINEETFVESIKSFFANKGDKIIGLNVDCFMAGRQESLNFIKGK